MNHPGIEALRTVLKRLRWDNQHGYPCYKGNGEWAFVSTAIGPATPDELNALFNLADLVPDVIVPLGECSNCEHAHELSDKKGHVLGYGSPCNSCAHPYHNHFVPRKS